MVGVTVGQGNVVGHDDNWWWGVWRVAWTRLKNLTMENVLKLLRGINLRQDQYNSKMCLRELTISAELSSCLKNNRSSVFNPDCSR